MREVAQRELELAYSEDVEHLEQERARAVLIPFNSTKGPAALSSRLSRIRPRAADHGMAVVVVAMGRHEVELARLQVGSLPIPVYDGQVPYRAAQACATHDPGPPAGPVHIKSQQPALRGVGELPTLFRRAFFDCAEIRVRKLGGGLSGATGVWRVDPVTNTGRKTRTFLVKAGAATEVDEEIETMRDFVLDYPAFPNRPPLLLDRCVRGHSQRLLVSMFVADAVRLDEHLSVRNQPVELLGASLVERTLAGWRADYREEDVPIGAVYDDLTIHHGKHSVGFEAASVKVRKAAGSKRVPDVVGLVQRFRELPVIRTRLCHAHGDLHARNIFVRGSGEVVLIDFAKSKHSGSPMARDLATLDVSLMSDELKDGGRKNAIGHAYRAPLLEYRAGNSAGPRFRLIQGLRGHAAAEACSETEYEIAVVAHLLRWIRQHSSRRKWGEQLLLIARLTDALLTKVETEA